MHQSKGDKFRERRTNQYNLLVEGINVLEEKLESKNA